MRRSILLTLFALALLWAQHEAGAPELHARLELAIDPLMPARVYLFKDGRPFRLSPVQALLPLRVDLFYRERLWTSSPSPDTLEVTCSEQSHFILLKGHGSFDLPQGHYRIEAYHGLFYVPANAEFDLRAGETRRVSQRLEDWTGGASKEWISGDDHIHLTRLRQDDDVFLRWLEAEDLDVGNFLQLQRQMDSAVQYAFGPAGEARRAAYSIRPGHESRSHFYGHINLLGGRELIRPLSVGPVLANTEEAYPWPSVLFDRGRRLGATVGYAHFNGGQHNTLLMDLALGQIDFIEVFQFGVLKREQWYELLNAGFRVTGIAGSDFPVPLNDRKPWPRSIPLLGPERTLVKARAGAGSPYEAWAAGVRSGNVVVTNGPLLDIQVDSKTRTVSASARFSRPLEKLEIVRNGQVIASVPGDGKLLRLTASATLTGEESCWVAARVTGQRGENEPEIQAHTNPVYQLRQGEPVLLGPARESLAKQWEAQLAWYKSTPLVFREEANRREFFARAAETTRKLQP
jgi:hypothetical protein